MFDFAKISDTEFVFLSLSSALMLLSAVVGLTKAFHMLQQNSYYISRYFEWVRTSPKLRGVIGFLFFAVVTILISFEIFNYIPLMSFAFLILVFRTADAVRTQRKAIKPLVFTGRVIRLYCTALIITALLVLLPLFFRKTVVTVVFISSVLLTALPYYATVISSINYFIEKLISNWYIGDAKRLLKAHKGMTVIGITGSYGKTSTKFVLGSILSQKFNVTITPASYNTPMGVVRTVREKLPPETEIFIAEMGAKKVGDIKEICDIVHPDLGIITSVGPQHLNTFHSVDNIIKTKFELADSVLRKKGTVFLNADNEFILSKKKTLTGDIVTYGTYDCDFTVKNVAYQNFESAFDVVYGNKTLSLSTKLLGKHNIQNIAAAAAVAVRLGVGEDDIRFAVARLAPAAHRLEIKPFSGGSVLIDDAYNANPAGSLEALNVLSGFDGFKKIIVTPGLVELGEKEYACNYNLGAHAAMICDEIYLVGQNRSVPLAQGVMSTGYDSEKLHIVSSFREAMDKLVPTLSKDCVVLFENDLPDNYSN